MQRSSPYRHADSTDTPRSALSGTPRSTTGVNTPRRDHGLRPSRGPSKSSIADTRHASSALDEELDPHPYFVAAFLRLALVVTGYVLTKSPSILLILIFNLIAVEAREIVVSRYAVNVEMMVQLLFYMLVMSVSVLFREWSSASVFATSVVTVNLIGVAACLEHRSQQGGFFHRKGRIFLATLRIVATTVLVLGLEHARRAVGGDGHVTGPVAMGAKVYNQSVEAGNDAASVVIMVVTLVLFEFSCGLKASHLGLGRFYQKVDEETLSAGEDEALERGEHSRRLSKSSKSSVLSAGGAGAGGTSHRRSGSSKTSYPTTREEWLFDAYPSRLTTQRPSKTTTESHREDEGGPSSKRERSKDSSVSRGSSKDSAGGGEGATPWTLGLGAGYTRAGSPRYNYSSMTSSYNAGAPTCSIPPRSPRFSPRITPSPEKQHSLNYARQGYRNAHSHRSNERHCEDFNTPGGGRDREVERKAKKMTARFIFVDSNTPPLSKETPVNPWTTRSPRPQSKDTPLVNYGYSSGSDGKGKNTSSDDPGPSGPSGPPTPSEQEFGAGWGTEGPVGPTVGGGGLDMDAGGGGGGWAGDKYFYV